MRAPHPPFGHSHTCPQYRVAEEDPFTPRASTTPPHFTQWRRLSGDGDDRSLPPHPGRVGLEGLAADPAPTAYVARLEEVVEVHLQGDVRTGRRDAQDPHLRGA